MKKTIVAALMAGVALPAYAADLSGDNYSYNFIQDNAPSSSQPKVVGHLQLGVGYFDFSADCGPSCSEDYWSFFGVGRANVDLGAFNLEIETGGSSMFIDKDFSLSNIGAAAHLWGRFNNAAFGIYGGVNFPSAFDQIYTAGAEGEAYIGNITLGAEANYNWWGESCATNCTLNFWTAHGWADVYVTPNARIGAEISYISFSSLGNFDIDGWGVGVNGEVRFAGTPFSLWAEGNYSSTRFFNDFNGDLWSGKIGFRVLLDGPNANLEDHDRAVPWDGGIVDMDRLVSITVFPPWP